MRRPPISPSHLHTLLFSLGSYPHCPPGYPQPCALRGGKGAAPRLFCGGFPRNLSPDANLSTFPPTYPQSVCITRRFMRMKRPQSDIGTPAAGRRHRRFCGKQLKNRENRQEKCSCGLSAARACASVTEDLCKNPPVCRNSADRKAGVLPERRYAKAFGRAAFW